MKKIQIKKLLREGLFNENEDYEQKIDAIVNKVMNSEDTLEPIQINDKYSFEKGNGKIILRNTEGNAEGNAWYIDTNEPERLKRILIARHFEDTKGQNIKASKYKIEKIPVNQLKIGDVYIRNLQGTHYVYKVLSNFQRYSDNPNFFNVKVKVLDVGNQAKHVSPKPDGGYDIMGKDVGDETIDIFKNKYGVKTSNKIEFGTVVRILNFEQQ